VGLAEDDHVRSAFDARRWGAHTLFRLASSILRGSIGLYEPHRIRPVVLRTALATVRILERSARIVLFGYRPFRSRKYPAGAIGDEDVHRALRNTPGIVMTKR